MDAFAYAAVLLGLLGGVVFAAIARRHWTAGVGLVAGAGLAWLLAAISSPVAIGVPAAVVAVGILFRPRLRYLAAGTAVMITGLAALLARQQLVLLGFDLPWASTPALVAATLLLPALSSFLARSPGYAPPSVQDESLIFVGLFGAVVAASPGIAAGWNSALALNVVQPQLAPIPGWVFAVAGTSIALGGVYCLWRRVN